MLSRRGKTMKLMKLCVDGGENDRKNEGKPMTWNFICFKGPEVDVN
jgi:hypothetical protein